VPAGVPAFAPLPPQVAAAPAPAPMVLPAVPPGTPPVTWPGDTAAAGTTVVVRMLSSVGVGYARASWISDFVTMRLMITPAIIIVLWGSLTFLTVAAAVRWRPSLSAPAVSRGPGVDVIPVQMPAGRSPWDSDWSFDDGEEPEMSTEPSLADALGELPLEMPSGPGVVVVYWIVVALVVLFERVWCEEVMLLFAMNSAATRLRPRLGVGLGRPPGAGEIGAYLLDVLAIGGSVAMQDLEPGAGGWLLVILAAIIALVLWRVFCEAVIVLHRISETVAEARRFPGSEQFVRRISHWNLLILPFLVKVVWFAGVLVALATIVMPPGGLDMLPLLVRVPMAFLGLLGLRLFCELGVALFNIHAAGLSLFSAIARRYGHPERLGYVQRGAPVMFRIMIFAEVVNVVCAIAAIAILVAAGYNRETVGMSGILLAIFLVMVIRVFAETWIIPFLVHRAFGALAGLLVTASGFPGRPPLATPLDYVLFRAMVSPIVLQITWVLSVLAVVAITGTAAVGAVSSDGMPPEVTRYIVMGSVGLGVLVIFFLRLFHESAMVGFCIHRSLVQIGGALDRLISAGLWQNLSVVVDVRTADGRSHSAPLGAVAAGLHGGVR
jgi:hypothetical protein